MKEKYGPSKKVSIEQKKSIQCFCVLKFLTLNSDESSSLITKQETVKPTK